MGIWLSMRFDAINPGRPVTAEEIDEYAAAHGLQLPPQLRRQLEEQNGGGLADEPLVKLAGGGEELVSSFFGIGMTNLSSELAWVSETFEGRVPTGMLPFADDPGGNLYLLDAAGSVWFWD